MTYIFFLVILFLWLISGILFPFDSLFYYSLNLPKFTPPSILFAIIWPILYFLLTLSFFIILKKDKVNRHYLFAYILNYILNQSFSLLFFYKKNLILKFYDIIFLIFIIIYITFMHLSTKFVRQNSTKLSIILFLILILISKNYQNNIFKLNHNISIRFLLIELRVI